MITYSQLIRVSGAPAQTQAWARDVARLLSRKTGATVNVSARVGGPQELMWISQYDDYDAFEQAQALIGADLDYARMMQSAREAGLIEPSTLDTAFWIPIGPAVSPSSVNDQDPRP